MKLKVIPGDFTVSQVKNYSQIDLSLPFTFTAATDEENSLVTLTENTPADAIQREDGWKAFRIEGPLGFSLIGILAQIASLLAGQKISIFAVSTYNTDYILVRKESFAKALDFLQAHGYTIER